MKEKADKQHKKEDKVLREGLRKIRNLRGGNKMKKTILILGLIALMTIGMVSAEYVKVEPDVTSNGMRDSLGVDGDWYTYTTGYLYMGIPDYGYIIKTYTSLDTTKVYYMRRKYNISGNIVENYWKLPNDCYNNANTKTYDYFYYGSQYVYFGCQDDGGYTTTPYLFEAQPYTAYYENDLYEYIEHPCIFKGKGLAKGWINKRC